MSVGAYVVVPFRVVFGAVACAGAPFVDDFVCDCCDGSDEAAGRCANTCDSEGASWRAEVQARLAALERGMAARRQLVEKAKLELDAARVDVAAKRTELQSADELVRTTSLARDQWSVRERLAKAYIEQQRKLAEPAATPDAGGSSATPPSTPDADAANDGDEEDDEDVTDDEPAVELPGAVPTTPEALRDEMFESGAKDEATLQSYIARAGEAAAAATSAQSRKDELARKVTELDELLAEQYGADGAYYALKGQCFSFTTSEYKYELCPFSSVTQRGLNDGGGGGTDMGRWKRETGWPATGNGRQWQFAEGLGCWQGPQRSTLVQLSCGAENALSTVRG